MHDNVGMRSSQFSLSANGKQLVFIRPAEPEEILDRISDEEFCKDEFMPYWAESWPASHVLFNYCADHLPVGPLRICELGCGLGIISSLCAGNGHQVFAIDISMDACRYTHANIRSQNTTASCVCSDWRFSKSFDMVLGADILYEERWIGPVATFLRDHLLSGGTALIADPQRKPWTAFKQTMISNGFTLARTETRQEPESTAMVEIVSFMKE
jgi:predicted nicotinamide N-methyase